MTAPTTSRSLLRHPDFLRFWTAQAISVFGSSITQLAIPLIAATVLEVSAFEFGLLTAIEFLPFILLSLPAGVWVDRLRRRPILIVADLGRALAIISIPIAFALDALTIWQLYAVGFVNGCLTVFFDIAYQSYLPSVLERDQLVDGNSKLEITRSAAQILGPGIAGVLIGLLRAPFAMLIDALSFALSAVFLGWIRRPEPAPPPHDEGIHGPRRSMRADIASGMRYVTGHRWLRSIAATTGISNFFGNVVGAILILYLTQARGLSAAAIGFAFSVASLGVLAGALSTGAITRRLGVGRVLLVAAVGFSLSGLPVALAPDALIWPAVAGSYFLGGFAGVAWNINQVSLRQAITPPRMQGRMNATMRFIVWGTIPLGALAGGILGDLLGLQQAILVGAIGGLVACLPVALSSVRHLVRLPEPVDDEPAAAVAAPA